MSSRSAKVEQLSLLVSSLFSLLLSLPAFSSPIVDGSGQLTGATDVNVNGVLYDVQFVDGTCIALFSDCDAASDFDFADPQTAQDAALALVNQVFLDGQLGAFDTDYTLTRGCEDNVSGSCWVIVPSEAVLSGGPWIAARNTNSVTVNDTTQTVSWGIGVDTSGFPQFVFARFTPANQPLADAGPDQAVRLGDTVFLDGGNSFDDETATDSLQFIWDFVSVTSGSSAVLAGADTATPSFVVDAVGKYVVQLTVTDEAGLTSSPDEMTVRMPLVDESGQLTGATDVNVNGVLHDVQFVDGTCIALFSDCDAASDFDFADPQTAQDAALALVNQVFLDGQLGAFDTDYTLTRGCEDNVSGSCWVIVPSEAVLSGGPWIAARNTNSVTVNDTTQTVSWGIGADTSGFPQFVFARFAPSASNSPPVAVCQAISLEADEACLADGSIDAGSYDPDGGEITLRQEPPGPYGPGPTTVTLIVTDENGASDSCDATVTVEDLASPVVYCNSPETITPPDAPVSFTATASDNCSVADVAITGCDCYWYNPAEKRVDKTNSCVVGFAGDAITIYDSGGVNDNIEWLVTAADTSGNTISMTCAIQVVNPSQ